MQEFTVPAKYLRTLRILHVIIGASFLPVFVLILLVSNTNIPTEADFRQIDLLSLINLFVLVVSFVAAKWIRNRTMQAVQENLQRAGTAARQSVWQEWLQRYRSTHVLTLATREGAAMLGWVVVLISALNGTLGIKPIYWANLISTGLFLAHLAMTFPTEERILAEARS